MNAAIAESGAGLGTQDNISYFAQGQEYAQALGCNTTDASLTSTCNIRHAPLTHLIDLMLPIQICPRNE